MGNFTVSHMKHTVCREGGGGKWNGGHATFCSSLAWDGETEERREAPFLDEPKKERLKSSIKTVPISSPWFHLSHIVMTWRNGDSPLEREGVWVKDEVGWESYPKHGCQMAIARFLKHMCLALGASGLWLHYATLQNLIPSFPCTSTPPPWCNSMDQILPSGNLDPKT